MIYLKPFIGVFLAMGLSTGAVAQPQPPMASYVEMSSDNQVVVLVITRDDHCPSVVIDNQTVNMDERVQPQTIAQRPTASSPDLSKPSEFPVRVCERFASRHVRSISLLGQALPVPKAVINRIIVIGDTGCRLKAADKAYQACNDPKAYPFARVAAQAAGFKPDLIVHVGDYLYRENPCTDDKVCAGSPWGYGWEAWQADFFGPAQALLHAAPLALSRGNHESCARAGQGWWRFLDPRPLIAHQDCNIASDDEVGDYSAPYGLDLGQGAQMIMFDSSNSSKKAIATTDPQFKQYDDNYQAIDAISSKADYNFLVDHHPLLSVSAGEKKGVVKLSGGSQSLQSVFGHEGRPLVPAHIDVLLSGHVHVWEQVSFSNDLPSQFVAGFSGTEEDKVPLPEKVTGLIDPADGAKISAFSSWVDGFGYMTLERQTVSHWDVKIWDLNGQVVNHCVITGKASHCDKAQVK